MQFPKLHGGLAPVRYPSAQGGDHVNTSYDHHDPPPPRRTDTAQLSPREEDVLRLIAAGYTDAMTADELGLASGTVKHHVKNLFRKLDALNRAHAVDTAWRAGLLGGDTTGGDR